MLRAVWQHGPVTALRFLSKSTILVGCANQLTLFNWIEDIILCSWTLHRFVTIHNLDIFEDLDRNVYLVVLGGNRFYAGAYLRYSDTSGWKFDRQFTHYASDNIVACCTARSDAADWGCFVGAHGHTIVSRIPSDAPLESPSPLFTESAALNNSTCYSGLIKCRAQVDRLDSVSFLGSTFGQVRIYISHFQFGLEHSRLTGQSTMARVLQCQKGVIFSLSLCELAEQGTVRLATAAEDRSIAIWTTDAMKNEDDIALPDELKHYCGSWNLLHLLKGGSLTDDVIFESRIWNVLASERGLLAVGEDCRIVWYPWDNVSNATVLSGTHRGHGIWCADIWLPKDNDALLQNSAVVVSGGNDGAICLQTLITEDESHSNVHAGNMLPHLCRFTQVEASSQWPVSSYPSGDLADRSHSLRSRRVVLKCTGEEGKNDFPRCLFFGPDGRLFYVTELGRIYTLSVSPEFTEHGHHVVYPFFRMSVSASLRSENSGGESATGEFDEDQVVSSVNNPGLSNLFCGYTVCATNPSHTMVAIGDRQGRVALLQFLTDSPYLVCTSVAYVEEKVMKLVWLDRGLLLVAMQSGPAVLFSVQRDMTLSVFSPPLTTLHASVRSTLSWISAGCLCSTHSPSNQDLVLVVVGTRDGGLYTFKLDLNDLNQSVDPTWSLQACHGRGGCTAVVHVPSACGQSIHVLSAGRTHGELRLWRVDPDGGGLLLRAIIPSSSNLTWVEQFKHTADNRLFALGFQSVHFKAYLLSPVEISATESPQLLKTESLNHSHGWFCAECGGGNRPWEWWTSQNPPLTSKSQKLVVRTSDDGTHHVVSSATIGCENAGDELQKTRASMAILATVNRSEVLVQWACSEPDSSSRLILPKYLKPSLHGRDINCCLLFRCLAPAESNRGAPQRRVSETLFCFAGSEDTTLSSWAISKDARDDEGWALFSQPEHHRGHMSNIRCITVPQVFPEGQCEPRVSADFLVTGGGRGQVGLWSLGLNYADSISNGAWRPGWLGFTRLRHTPAVTEEAAGAVGSGNWTAKAQRHPGATDLRVMALVCLKFLPGSLDEWLLAMVACSDGSIRLLHIQPPTSAHPRNPIFLQLGSLEVLSGQPAAQLPRACYLDLQLAQCDAHSFLVVGSTSLGELRGWRVQCCSEWDQLAQSDLVDQWRFSLHWYLLADPIAPFHVSTKPAFNCLASLDPIWPHEEQQQQQQCSLRLAVGADDGSLRVVRVPSLLDSTGDNPRWLCSAVHHFTTVVRLCVLQSDPVEPVRNLCTLSADQRLIWWQFDRRCDQLTALRRTLLPGLGDPHGMAVELPLFPADSPPQATEDRDTRTFVLTTGTGSTLLELSHI